MRHPSIPPGRPRAPKSANENLLFFHFQLTNKNLLFFHFQLTNENVLSVLRAFSKALQAISDPISENSRINLFLHISMLGSEIARNHAF
jgi:hypothetical protein